MKIKKNDTGNTIDEDEGEVEVGEEGEDKKAARKARTAAGEERLAAFSANACAAIGLWTALPLGEARVDDTPAVIAALGVVGREAKALAQSDALNTKQKRVLKLRSAVAAACFAEARGSFTFD